MDFSTTYHILCLCQKRLIISRKMQTKDNVVQSIPFIDENPGDDARSLLSWYSSSRIWCIPIALASLSENYHCLPYLLWGIADSKKNTTIESRQNTRRTTSKQYMRQSISLFRKVMISLLANPVKLLALLGSPSCRLLLLPLLRWSYKLLASGGLLCSSGSFFLAVDPDVWPKQNTLLPGACAI